MQEITIIRTVEIGNQRTETRVELRAAQGMTIQAFEITNVIMAMRNAEKDQ